MARTPSNMLALGTKAPHFALPDPVSRGRVSIKDFAGRPLLVMFLSNHCPFVKHVKKELIAIGQEFSPAIGVVAINSNDVENYPDDSPEKMKLEGYPFPYLFDESQAVAKAYEAACTPDFFLFDATHLLVYRGQLDGSRPGNEVPVDGADLRRAMRAVVGGEAVSTDQKPSLGCNIKWKA
jgi:thiol-disulfide isomerase/thioredoxin